MRVGVIFENRADFFFHWFALNTLGVSIVPLNAEASPDDLGYIVNDSGLSLVISLPEKMPFAQEVIEGAGRDVPVVRSDETDTLGQLPSGPANSEVPGLATECALLYTSGSTGKPKGCMLSNEYFIVMGEWYRDLGGYCEIREGEDRLLTPLPLVHMNALSTSTMVMLMTGGCIIQLDRFHPSTWWKTLAESGATIMHYLGVLPAILLNMPAGPYDRAHKVRFGFGAGVNPKHHAVFEDRFGIPLIEAWSMTEVGGAAGVIANHEPRHVGTCCFGKPVPEMEYNIVNDSGEPVAPGESGELLVRRAGDNPRYGFFSGYFGKPKETAEAWENGWFHSGDVVRQGPDGAMHFVDRKKSIIRRSGENISSLEVEAVFSQIPGVSAVGVAPAPDEIRGEEVFAAIVPADGVQPNEAEAERLIAAAADRLTYYKVPGYIAFLAALPLTASQKLQRGELKKMAKELVEAGKVYDLRHAKKKSVRKGG